MSHIPSFRKLNQLREEIIGDTKDISKVLERDIKPLNSSRILGLMGVMIIVIFISGYLSVSDNIPEPLKKLINHRDVEQQIVLNSLEDAHTFITDALSALESKKFEQAYDRIYYANKELERQLGIDDKNKEAWNRHPESVNISKKTTEDFFTHEVIDKKDHVEGQVAMRDGPGVENTQLAVLNEGERVKVLRTNENGSWSFITGVERAKTDGWISSSYLKPID